MSNCTDSSCLGIVSSNCTSWQGSSYDDLDIKIGNSITYVVSVVIDKIRGILKGQGIELPDLDLTDSDYLTDLLGCKDKNLLNILDIYKKAIDELKAEVDTNTSNIESFFDVTSYTLGILTPENSCLLVSFKDLIQSIITKINNLNTQYENIVANLSDTIEETVKEVLLNGFIKSAGGNGIKYSGTTSSGNVIITGLVPPYCPVLFTGPTNQFDVTGKGMDNTPYEGWWICNGNNSTPNSSTLPQNASGNLKYIIRFN